MCEKITDCLSELGEEIEISKRELGLGLLCCLLLGIVVGIFCSPKKRVMIGSHNACNNGGCCNYDCEESQEQ